MKNILIIGLVIFAIGTFNKSFGQTNKVQNSVTNSAAGDVVWKELQKAFRPPTPPAEWRDKRPSEAEIEKFKAQQRDLSGSAADKAKDFYTRFPKHPKAGDAREKEREMLGFAVQLGDTNKSARLEALEVERLKDPSLTEDERFEFRAEAIQRNAGKKEAEGKEAMMAEFEKGVRQLQKEFPKREEVYQMLMTLASNSSEEKSRALAKEIIDSSAPDKIKDSAKGILKKMDAVGKPLAIEFKSLDGKDVSIARLAGKVVLVDFWATWCGPCVGELPHVKETYEKLHPKGFEIIGISFDQDKEALESFVAKEKMPWPQYFDGEGWKNKFGKEFGINSIPAMWLVDKKGILRDLNGREDLAKKVEKYLAE